MLGQVTPAAGYSGVQLALAGFVGVAIGVFATALVLLPDPATHGPHGSGYYVLLYNAPRGHRDRRLKGYNGPYASRAKADANAEREKSVWYPSVRKLSADPRALGM